MNAKITKFDVFLYFADELDRSRRRELEMACSTDAQVQQWFDELTPTEEELDRAGVPLTMPSETQWEPAFRALEDWFHSTPEQSVADAPAILLPPHQLVRGDRGQLACRVDVPLRRVAEHVPATMKPDRDIPCIEPDFDTKKLCIRQWVRDLARGEIMVHAARLLSPGRAEHYFPRRVELFPGKHPDGAYWYGEFPIRLFVPHLNEGDEVLFYAEPAAGKEP